MEFHIILRNLIEDADLTQKQFAKDIGIAPSTVGGYVQGISEPDFETLKIIAEYFHVSTDYLLDIHSSNTNSFDENEILRIYRSIEPKHRKMYIDIGKAIIKNN